jgi:D-sedoheptulose 7-phosphate isomerase
LTNALGTSAAEARVREGERYFAAVAEPLAALCHRMSERFGRGGRLLALGRSPQARSDARHVAVEFVHPVIVGKRALPALALTDPVQLDLEAEADDIVMAFDPGAAVEAVRERGCETVAFAPAAAEWQLDPGTADPFISQELAETAYHVLWELVHVFFEHRGGSARGTGASSFLYPFLGERETDLDAVLADVRASVLAKAEEIGALRAQTLREGDLAPAASAMRNRLDAGGRVLALGNGGSATDAMDAVADLAHPPHGWPARRALDLTDDTGVITAVANDIGAEAIFARQVIAHGRAQDVLLTFSTSGSSANVLAALEEGRRRGLHTVSLVGYDGGRIAADALADHVIVTRSEHIPRIQEAQASAWHVLRGLLESA